MTSIVDLLKMVVKYGGLNLVLLLVLSWAFEQYFSLNPDIITVILNYVLWYAFFETIFVMFVSRIFWVMQKYRDFKAGKTVVEEIDSQSISQIGKEMGLDTAVKIASTLKDMIVKTPEAKEKKELEKALNALEDQIAELESEQNV
jgi:hypothetical protein